MGDKMKEKKEARGRTESKRRGRVQDKVVPVRKKGKKPVSGKELLMFAGAIVLFLAMMAVIISQCRIETVVVSGNETYSKDEIEAVVRNEAVNNTVFYTVLAAFSKNDYLPFVEEMNVTFIDQNTIWVEVTEKLRAGMVQEMDEYFYFDKDGIIREASANKIKNVPIVTGLQLNDCVLNEQLKPKEEDVFSIILKMTQLIIKYEIPVSEIQFNTLSDIRMKCGQIQVKLGTVKDLDAKMAELPAVLESLYGKQGTLNMESFSEADKIISFALKR